MRRQGESVVAIFLVLVQREGEEAGSGGVAIMKCSNCRWTEFCSSSARENHVTRSVETYIEVFRRSREQQLSACRGNVVIPSRSFSWRARNCWPWPGRSLGLRSLRRLASQQVCETASLCVLTGLTCCCRRAWDLPASELPLRRSYTHNGAEPQQLLLLPRLQLRSATCCCALQPA